MGLIEPNCALGEYHRPPCKSLSTEKHGISFTRSGERVVGLIRIDSCARLPLG